MLQKLKRDIFSKSNLKISEDVFDPTLNEYYIIFEENPKKLNRLIVDFDKNGIPLNTSYVDVEDKNLHYYPISIGQYALAIFHTWLQTKERSKRDYFIQIAEWFYKAGKQENERGRLWITEVPKPEYGLASGWRSSFSQSRAISVMLRAWQITNDRKYLDASKQALIPFMFDISNGGVSVRRKNGEVMYEEYVAEYPTRVIDGHIFSLFGLYDFVRAVTPETDREFHELGKKLFNEGVEGLANLWPQLDLGFWFRYSLTDVPGYPKNDPCTVGYLRLIRNQLKVLIKITDNESLKQFYNKTIQYDNAFNIVKMYRLKYRALKQLNRL